MLQFILVGIGGSLGAMMRYFTSNLFHKLFPSISFPIGTLMVNLIGCFLIGMLSQVVHNLSNYSQETQLLFLVGLLGSFTTYSTFSNDIINLIDSKQMFFSILSLMLHVIFGILAVVFGRVLGKLF